MTMRAEGYLCVVCEGGGQVVWDDGLPRRIRADDALVVTICPACDGSGIEPTGYEQNVSGEVER